MGMFDDNTSNRKYNDAIPNYDTEDGVDIVRCDASKQLYCVFRDINKHRCLFETCILEQAPYTVKHHKSITFKCPICDDITTKVFKAGVKNHPLVSPPIICEKCQQVLFEFIKRLREMQEEIGDSSSENE